MKALSQKHIPRPVVESSHAPDAAAAQPFGSALPSKEPSHSLLRHVAVQGLEENLISHLTGAILGMNPTPGQGLHTLNHSPCCYLQYQSQERLSHELPGAVQTHQIATPMLSLEGNMTFKVQFQSEQREIFSKSPLESATGLLQRPQSNTLTKAKCGCPHRLPPAQNWSCPDPLQLWLDTSRDAGWVPVPVTPLFASSVLQHQHR